MKKLFKKILVLAVVLGTYTGYANEVLEAETTFNHVTKGSQISVTDASGEVIYSGKVNYNGNLTKLFDFSQLKNGKYTVEITKDFEIEIHKIQVKNHTVSFINADHKTVHKPVVRNENARVLISKLALDTNEMTVELYFEGDLILSEIVKGNKVLSRVYKLDKKIKGDYTTIIRSNDRVFTESFSI